MLRDLAKHRQDEYAQGDVAIVAFMDKFSVRTNFASLLQRFLHARNTPVPRLIVYASTALSVWISNKTNLAECLTGPGFAPETIVYRAHRDHVSVYKMHDETALMHRHKQATTRWYVKPVGQSEGRGIRVTHEANLSDIAGTLRSHAVAANARLKHDQQRDYLCQREITPPLLVRTKLGMCKFDVRFYAIVNTRGQCVVYPDARVRCANSSYDASNLDAVTNVCNTTLQSKLLGRDTKDLIGPKMLSQMEDGQALIRESIALITRAVQHVVASSRAHRDIERLHEHAVELGATVYSALGVDIGFDIEGRPWIIEINKRPALLHEEYYRRSMNYYLEAMLGAELEAMDKCEATNEPRP